jgi:hypothetical protein
MIMYDIWDAAAGASHASQRNPFEEALKSPCEKEVRILCKEFLDKYLTTFKVADCR